MEGIMGKDLSFSFFIFSGSKFARKCYLRKLISLTTTVQFDICCKYRRKSSNFCGKLSQISRTARDTRNNENRT